MGPEASGKEAKLGFEPEAADNHMMSHMTSYIRTTESKICVLETSTGIFSRLSMCQAQRQKDISAAS